MGERLWRVVAWVVSRRPIANAIIRYAQREPYTFLYGYMERWWVFNPWNDRTYESRYPWFGCHIRVHHILREDLDDDLHNHPWAFRTIILRGGYLEQREEHNDRDWLPWRGRGHTYRMGPNEFHAIRHLTGDEETWTLFITGRKVQSWGFKTKGGIVPWREYPTKKPEVPTA